MSYIKSYKELIVWKKSFELVKEIFILTDKFPKSELYGIVSQMRRAAIAIPSNIAEGYGRKSTKSYTQFYAIAYGSALELETQTLLSKELELTTQENFKKVDNLLIEVCKMLNSMITKMRRIDN
jgi:four helix bundle protein